jgi:hypothetical protein
MLLVRFELLCSRDQNKGLRAEDPQASTTSHAGPAASHVGSSLGLCMGLGTPNVMFVINVPALGKY